MAAKHNYRYIQLSILGYTATQKKAFTIMKPYDRYGLYTTDLNLVRSLLHLCSKDIKNNIFRLA